VHDKRHLVEIAGIRGIHNCRYRHITEVGNLTLQLIRNGCFAAADDDIRLDTPAAQFCDRVLGGLRFLFARWSDKRNQGDMDVANVLTANIETELPDCFKEREDLDIADSATNLGDDDIDIVGSKPGNPSLDFVSDVRDYLNCLAEIIPTSLSGNDSLVDGASCGIRVAAQRFINEPFVMSEIEVGLAPIISDEYLTMFERVHGAGIDIEIRVEFLHRDAQPTTLEKTTQRGGRNPLAQR